MIVANKNFEIVTPKNQLQLYGYKYYFDTFANLFKNNKLPNTILLSGLKGSGKATFAYHFINYLLSYNEQNKYLVKNFTINPDNKTYKSVCDHTHPNFFLLENDVSEENIKIGKVRDILKFLHHTTYYSNIKIVLIDNAEYLNKNSSNALLKVLEEPYDNTFFFIIHNSMNKILDTIKSRCIEFKFFFSIVEKKNILQNIVKQYDSDLILEEIDDNLYFDTPGNILKYLKVLNEGNVNSFDNKLSCIFYLIDKYKQKKEPQLLIFISSLVEIFYNQLCLNNEKNLNIYFNNRSKILQMIDGVKKFNLDKNNLFISMQNMLKNES